MIKSTHKSISVSISAQQVIVSLKSAVKELIENSLDAKATKIQIDLKNYGMDEIVVRDNGHGVRPENFENLAVRHATSKIRAFKDLTRLEDFGFRGEALHALAHLGDLRIHTRTIDPQDSSVYHEAVLIFDKDGRLVQKQQAASAGTGEISGQQLPSSFMSSSTFTIVTVSNLFAEMPVRRNQILNNIKREYPQLLNKITSYAIIHTSVDMVVAHEGKIKLSTSANRLNEGGEYDLRNNLASIFGPKLLASLNKISLQYSPEQFQNQQQPTLDITSDCFGIDCDAEPIDDGKEAEETCTSSFAIDGYFSKTVTHSAGAVGQGRASADRQFMYVNKKPCQIDKLSRFLNDLFRTLCQTSSEKYACYFLNLSLPMDKVDFNLTADKFKVVLNGVLEKEILSQLRKALYALHSETSQLFASQSHQVIPLFQTLSSMQAKLDMPAPIPNSQPHQNASALPMVVNTIPADDTASKHPTKKLKPESFNEPFGEPFDEHFEERFSERLVAAANTNLQTNAPGIVKKHALHGYLEGLVGFSIHPILQSPLIEMSHVAAFSRPKKSFAPDSLSQKATNAAALPSMDMEPAEATLKRFNKANFSQMQVIGQFNLGFILATYLDSLYIIDQHASDEIHTFLTLIEKKSHLESLQLLFPVKLDLSYDDVATLTENLNVFQQYGFFFSHKENGVFLTHVPSSPKLTFGKEDVYELISILSSSVALSNYDLIPTRVRSMYASKACRTSVMIGTSLTIPEMKQILTNLSKIKKPWNCPHGRPTMRHLMDFKASTFFFPSS